MKMLADQLHMSQPTLYRKIKQRSELAAIDMIRSVRMSKAASLILENRYSMQEIAEMVGYNDTRTLRCSTIRRISLQILRTECRRIRRESAGSAYVIAVTLEETTESIPSHQPLLEDKDTQQSTTDTQRYVNDIMMTRIDSCPPNTDHNEGKEGNEPTTATSHDGIG